MKIFIEGADLACMERSTGNCDRWPRPALRLVNRAVNTTVRAVNGDDGGNLSSVGSNPRRNPSSLTK
jgi:hypothetical protein